MMTLSLSPAEHKLILKYLAADLPIGWRSGSFVDDPTTPQNTLYSKLKETPTNG